VQGGGCDPTPLPFADGQVLPHVRFGEEPRYVDYKGDCPDCAVGRGQVHHTGCDIERCPRCGLQFIGCDCELASAESLQD